MPPSQHYIEITLPMGLAYEIMTTDSLPGWDTALPSASRTFGRDWIHACRTAVLMVPSFAARIEFNILINQPHLQSAQIEHSLPAPIWWDRRLFSS